MISEEQYSEIRVYLIEQKLPIDILMEVNDHFISQIIKIQQQGNSFDKAFEEAKKSWKKDLKPSWDGGFDLDDKSQLVRNERKQNFKSLFVKSTAYGLLVSFFVYSSMIFLTENQFLYFMITLYIVFVFGPVVVYFFHRKDFGLARKYSNYVLTECQTFVFTYLTIPAVSIQFLVNINHLTSYWYQAFHSEIIYDNRRALLMTLAYFILIVACIFIFFSQRRYLKQIQKVKPFLQFLKPS